MKKVVAAGLLVISIMFGSLFVIAGATGDQEISVWFGMIIIAAGIINAAVKFSVAEKMPSVEIGVSKRKKPGKKQKERRKR